MICNSDDLCFTMTPRGQKIPVMEVSFGHGRLFRRMKTDNPALRSSMGWYFKGAPTMTRLQLEARKAWIRAYDRTDDGTLASGGTLYHHGILHAKRLLRELQSSPEWAINVTYKSRYYELNGRLRVDGADRQAMFDAILERYLREKQASSGSPDQGQTKAPAAPKS